MRRNLTLTSLISLFWCAVLSAQNPLDYNQYVYPDVRRSALDVTLYTFGQNSGAKFSEQTKVNSSGFTGRGSFLYSLIANDRRLQQVQNFSGNLLYDFEKTSFTNAPLENRHTEFSFSLTYNNTQRNYSPNNNYDEIYYGVFSNLYSRSLDEQKNKYLNTIATGGYRIGTGRIEPADELFQAQFIMDDLARKGLLVDKSQNGLFALGQLLAVQRQRRLLDFRVLYVNQLESISQWLAANTENFEDINFATAAIVTSDNWLYNQFNNRAIGSRQSLGLDVRYNLYSNLEGRITDLYQLGLYGEIYHTKPKNKHLHTSSLILGGVIYNNGNLLTSRTVPIKSVNPFFSGAFKAGYYPVSRTALTLTGSVSAQANIPQNGNRFGALLRPEVIFGTQYFINYRTSFRADLTLFFQRAGGSFRYEAVLPGHEIYGNQSVLFRSYEQNFQGLFSPGIQRHGLYGSVTLSHAFF